MPPADIALFLLPSRVRGQRAGLFLIPRLLQGRKRAPAASPPRAAPARPGGDAGGPACPSACCCRTRCVASGRRQPRFPASLCQKPLIKAGLPALLEAEPTFPVTLPSLRTRCSVGKANLPEGLHIAGQGWEPSSISVAVPWQGSAQLHVHPKICFKRALCWGCLKI